MVGDCTEDCREDGTLGLAALKFAFTKLAW